MKNNNQYILLLLCVLLIFILIQKNREYFENSTKEQLKKEQLEKELKQIFNEDKEDLIAFINSEDTYKKIVEDESDEKKTIRETITKFDHDKIIDNNLLEKYKKQLEIKKQDKLKIYFIHKLYEEGDKVNLKIQNILLVIELDINKKAHKVISVQKYTDIVNNIIPHLNLVPDSDKFKIMKKKFDDKIGSMPDPSECVIS